MPGSNAGTGQPLTLRCAKCKVLRDYRRHEDKGTNLEATGKIRKLWGREACHGGVRLIQFMAQYRCLDCGHVGWSRHCHMEVLLKRAGFRMIEDYGLVVWAERA